MPRPEFSAGGIKLASGKEAHGSKIEAGRSGYRVQPRVIDSRHLQAYSGADMPMRRVSLFLPDHLLKGLDQIKQEHGTPQAESIRRAIDEYLKAKGFRLPNANRKSTRQKER